MTDSQKAHLFVEAANGALSEGDATGALQNLHWASELDDSLPELHHTRALALSVKRDLPGAIAEARKATELKSDYPDAWDTLGKLLMDAGRPNEAVPALLKAANDVLYRDSYKARTNLGILYYRKPDLASAARYFDLAIQDSPSSACIAYYYRGHLKLRDGLFKEAEKDYQHATQKGCAGFADAHLALGIAYERAGQYDLARRKYLAIQSSFPSTRVADAAMDHLRSLP